MDIQAYIQSGVIESYVLGIATEEEISEVEQLLSKHPEVQKAIDEFSSSLEQYALANAVPPPVDIKGLIKKELEEEFRPLRSPSLNVVVNNTREQQKLTPPPKYKVWRFAAAASIVLLLVSSAVIVYLLSLLSAKDDLVERLRNENSRLDSTNIIYQASLSEWKTVGDFLGDTGISVIRMKDVTGKQNITATAFWNRKTKEVSVIVDDLSGSLPADKQYQLWVMVGGKPVSVGMIPLINCGVACKMARNVEEAQGFAISREKKEEEIPTDVVVAGKI